MIALNAGMFTGPVDVGPQGVAYTCFVISSINFILLKTICINIVQIQPHANPESINPKSFAVPFKIVCT